MTNPQDHLPERQSEADPALRGTIFVETSTVSTEEVLTLCKMIAVHGNG